MNTGHTLLCLCLVVSHQPQHTRFDDFPVTRQRSTPAPDFHTLTRLYQRRQICQRFPRRPTTGLHLPPQPLLVPPQRTAPCCTRQPPRIAQRTGTPTSTRPPDVPHVHCICPKTANVYHHDFTTHSTPPGERNAHARHTGRPAARAQAVTQDSGRRHAQGRAGCKAPRPSRSAGRSALTNRPPRGDAFRPRLARVEGARAGGHLPDRPAKRID